MGLTSPASGLPVSSLLLLVVAIWTNVCDGQPILPSLSYPVFVFGPPDAKQYQPVQQPGQQPHSGPIVVSDTVHPYQVPPPLPAPAALQQGYEVSQFHSQDEDGGVVYGFQGPDQMRVEARASDGTVRGTYSYIDPNGNVVKMQYWDDGSGFHMTGNGLPNGYPAYTPEVAAARAQHLKIHQAAMQAAGGYSPSSDGTYVINHGDYPSGNTYFDENMSQYDQGSGPNSLYSDDPESVALDNPELFGSFNPPPPPQEDKREEKPSHGSVEGEVELGEDVGPDEEEEEEHEEHDDEEIFRKTKENEENTGLQQNQHNGKNEDVPKKFFNRYHKNQAPVTGYLTDFVNGFRYVSADKANEDPKTNEEDVADKSHEDTEEYIVHDVNQEPEGEHKENDDHEENAEEHDNEQEHDKSEDEEEEHEQENEHDEDENESEEQHENHSYEQDDELSLGSGGKSIEEKVDEHLGEGPKFGERRRDGPKVAFGDRLHKDAEPSENRKNQVSQVPAQRVNSFERFDTGSIGRIPDLAAGQSTENNVLSGYPPNRAFFYHYLHTIPLEREAEERSEPAVVQPQPAMRYSASVRQPVAVRLEERHDAQVPAYPQPAVHQPPRLLWLR